MFYSFIMTCVLAFNSLVSANQGESKAQRVCSTERSETAATTAENNDEEVVIQEEDESTDEKVANS